MKMQIIQTTDGRYIGHEFDSEDNPIRLSDDVAVQVDKKMDLGGSAGRFINSNYVIDAIEV